MNNKKIYKIDEKLYRHAKDHNCEVRYISEVKRCIDLGMDYKTANESAYQEVEYIISGQEEMDEMAKDMWDEILIQRY
jgi:Na+-translocating ferredoxin:NAD+ oxidoreductase RnfC subunit|tara:strand:+ start:12924 stop:13157 length:234 start_codon:yes stop_codon:yes gene_type:complete